MAWIKCESCGFFYDTDNSENGGKIIFKGNWIGMGCNDCQNKVREAEKEKG